MSDFIHFGNRTIQPNEEIDSKGKVILYESATSPGMKMNLPMQIEGWAREENIGDWTKSGQWKKADLLASAFSITTRAGNLRYELPAHQAIKSIAIQVGNKLIVRIITREPQGAEVLVCKRFTKTGLVRLRKTT